MIITDIKDVIEQIRPFLQRDGGDIEYVDYIEKSKIVQVRLLGHCAGCPGAQMTLKNIVETILKDAFPEHVNAVEGV